MPVKVQEAQLPLRNRASAMHFFVAKLLSVAEMTYTCVNHLQNPKPMSDDPAYLLHTHSK